MKLSVKQLHLPRMSKRKGKEQTYIYKCVHGANTMHVISTSHIEAGKIAREILKDTYFVEHIQDTVFY